MMRKTVLAAAVLAAPLAPAAALAGDDSAPGFTHVSCKGGANEIRVTISNVKDNVGLIVADLYPDKEEGFLHSPGRLYQVAFAARAPQTTFCMYAPAKGKFAISVYHDKNANKDFDKGAFGLPAEPYGVSNNPPMRFAAPTVDESVFDVDGGAAVEIRLRG